MLQLGRTQAVDLKALGNMVTAERAVGRVCAELIAPYPPGIPVLAPGEVVTAEVLAALRGVRADGGRIAYAADPDLATIHVVAGPEPGGQRTSTVPVAV